MKSKNDKERNKSKQEGTKEIKDKKRIKYEHKQGKREGHRKQKDERNKKI